MNEQKQLLKKIKIFTLMLAFYSAILAFLSFLGSILLVFIQNELGAIAPELVNFEISRYDLYSGFVTSLTFIVLTIFFFIENSKLKKGQVVGKISYVLFILVHFVSLVSGLLLGTTVLNTLYSLAVSFLAVVPLLYLAKIEGKSIND